MTKILLVGYYGRVNLGDEAILDSIINELGRGGILKKNIAVASLNPKDTKNRHGVRSLQIKNVFSIFKALIWSNMIIFGGGGYHLYWKTNAFYIYIVAIARLYKRRVCTAFIGIEPIIKPLDRLSAGLLFRMINWISVRDKESCDELVSIGIRKTITIGADPGISITDRYIYAGNKSCEYGLVAISLVAPPGLKKYRNIEPTYPLIVDTIIEEFKVKVVLINTSEGEGDLILSRKVFNLCKQKERIKIAPWPKSLIEIIDSLFSVDFVLAMRYHVLIAAAIAGKPCAVISRSPKIISLANALNQPIVGNIKSNKEPLIANIKTAYRRREEIKRELAIETNKLYELYKNGFCNLQKYIFSNRE